MDKMVAFCGIVCTECPAYVAKKENNDELRKKTAEQWSKDWKMEITPESINCDGCLTSDGELIQYCSVCEIRKCARAKNVKNCAYCDEYICEKLEKWFKNVPDAKERLDKIRENK
jgi:hypothetical protein